jgi:hypothetical protein
MAGSTLKTLNLIQNSVKQNVDYDEKGKPKFKKGSNADKAYRVVVGKKETPGQKLQERKNVSARTAVITSTLGLGALGAKGAGLGLRHLGAAKKVPKLLKKLPGHVGNKKAVRIGQKVEDAAVPVTLVSGGIGGLAGYNYAAIQRAEARRKRQSTLNKAYDPEWSRKNRNKTVETGLAGAGSAAVAGAGVSGYLGRHDLKGAYTANKEHKLARGKLTAVHATHQANRANYHQAQQTYADLEHKVVGQSRGGKRPSKTALKNRDVQGRKVGRARFNLESSKTLKLAAMKNQAATGHRLATAATKAKRVGGRTGVLLGAGAAGLSGAAYLRNKRTGSSWASYEPRYRPNR